MKYLIKQGVNINAPNASGRTYLHFPNAEIEMAKIFLENGIDLKAKDEYGRTPLHCVCAGYCSIELAKLLIEKGADVNSKDEEGRTPMHTVCKIMRLDLAVLLLKHGANVNSVANNGETPLYCSVPSFSVVSFLLESGASTDCFVKESKGRPSLLHFAAAKGHVDTVKLLLNAGADPTRKSKEGLTPYLMAEKEDIVNLLRSITLRTFVVKRALRISRSLIECTSTKNMKKNVILKLILWVSKI